MAWLQAHDRWLLILDNVNDPGDVEPLLGQLTGGHLLITTRRDTGWDQVADPIRLDVLAPGPAAKLLTTRTGHHDPASQDAAASIADELGYLPLALHQAAAYITQTRIAPAAYLARLRQHPSAMYAREAGKRSGPSPGCGTSPSTRSGSATRPGHHAAVYPCLLRPRPGSPRHPRRRRYR